MDIRLQDILSVKGFSDLRLISGKNGMSNLVNDCGLLDYEFVKSLSNRYIYSNFHKGQLLFSSLMFAKDNPFLIMDAIRHLVDADACGLVINNVFQIKIPETTLGYADAKDFPIFISNGKFFDPVPMIIDINDYINELKREDFGDRMISSILFDTIPSEEIRTTALKMNPSFTSQICAVYMEKKTDLSVREYYDAVKNYQKSPLYNHKNSLYRYRNGFLYLISSDEITNDRTNDYINDFIDLLDPSESCYIGIGSYHYDLKELDQAVREALYAALINRSASGRSTNYSEMGTYRIILPLIDEPAMIRYSDALIDPIVEYDSSYKTALLDTLLEYVKADGKITKLAQDSKVHENTIRYRLNQIEKSTGLNPIKPGDYEQLAIAVKIYICRRLI